MSTTRRGFLATSSLVPLGLLLPRAPAWALPAPLRSPAPGQAPTGAAAEAMLGKSPLPALESLATRALELGRSGGASYVDVRLVATTREQVEVKDRRIERVSTSDEIGLGVRVIVDGAWGFAATSSLDAKAVDRATKRAVATATADAALRKRLGAPAVQLAPAPAVKGSWVSPHGKDPFAVSAADKAALLLRATEAALAVAGVKHADAGVTTVREDKLVLTSEGTRVHQITIRIVPDLNATAVDRRRGRFASRDHEAAPMLAGWEYVEELDLAKAAPVVAADALRKLHAPPVEPGTMQVVLAPSNLWLTIHESVGHPTELDRALRLEANFAGTSFLRPEDTGKLQYGDARVNLVADRTQPGGLATVAWDDEGVASQRWDLVKAGKFVGWQTTREQAAWIGETASRGCSYGQGYGGVPFQRMPNVSLQPGPEGYTTEDLINATEKGLLVTGRGSWSIDQQRHNFQFGGQMFFRIHRGRIAGVVRDAAYQANTLSFWRSCDMLGGKDTYRLGGSMGDGKGEPQQSNAVSHGCPPGRFTAAVIRTGGDR